MSDSLRPHESQHARPPCPSPTPEAHSNTCQSSRWCHPAISSSVTPFSSCPQPLPASGSFPMSQLFAWGGQSIGVSASASVLPIKANYTQKIFLTPDSLSYFQSISAQSSRILSQTTKVLRQSGIKQVNICKWTQKCWKKNTNENIYWFLSLFYGLYLFWQKALKSHSWCTSENDALWYCRNASRGDAQHDLTAWRKQMGIHCIISTETLLIS